MKKVEINCDNCGEDLRHTKYSSASFISVVLTPKGHETNTVYAMSSHPPLDRDYHFCNLTCLLTRFSGKDGRRPRDEIQKELNRIEFQEHGPYEKLSGASAALKWTLGETLTLEV